MIPINGGDLGSYKYLRLATSKVCATASPLDGLQAPAHTVGDSIPAPA